MPYPKKLLNDYETVALDLHPHWWYFAEAGGALIGSMLIGLASWIFLDGDAQKAVYWIALILIVLSALWLDRAVPQVVDDQLRDHQ